MAALLLEVLNVSRRYPSPDNPAGAIVVLDEVSLELRPGESVAIVGPSGSGKSTLLQLCGTLDRPDSGKIFLEGTDVTALGQAELAVVRNRQLGFVFQAHYLLPQCTVLENVLVPTLPLKPTAAQRQELAARATQLLERVGLGGRAAHLPGQLSGGERQRAAVVRALINRPRLLLADEPTGSLDQAAARELAALLAQLNREDHLALLLVTHSVELAAQMQRTLVLRNGKLAAAPPAS